MRIFFNLEYLILAYELRILDNQKKQKESHSIEW